MKSRFAVVVGLDYHAKFLAGLMNEQCRNWRLRAYDSSRAATLRSLLATRRAAALITFGGPAPNAALTEAARRRNIPVIVIWAGTDVLKARENPPERELLKQERFIHFAVSPWLVEELREIRIEAQYMPVAGMQEGEPVKPFPREFRVLSYLPEPRRDFYGERLVYDVARAMPDVEFDIAGAGGHCAQAPPNVRFLGQVRDMAKRIDDCAVLLRHPQHDGTSMLVAEALSRARHVVWNYEFPHVHTASGAGAVLAQLRQLQSLHAANRLELNTQGRAFVLEKFGRARIARGIEQRLDEAVASQPARTRPQHRVAISGLGLFCGEVVQNARALAPEWETRILRTGSRLEVLTSIVTLLNCDVWYSIGSPVTDRWVHLAARLLRKPRVIHWVGSDIATLNMPRMRAALSGAHALHLAEIGWTADQLREYDLETRIAPLPPRQRSSGCVALPPHFTIMLYVPRTRSDFYGRRAFERLIQRLADRRVRYIVVGGGEIQAPAGVELRNLGWRDNLQDVYADASVLIRYTPRDGLSLMVLEALSFGRYVLWTQPFPHVRRIATYTDIEQDVLELLALHERGELQPQHDASRLVEEQYGSAQCTRAIVSAWQDAIQPHPRARFAVEGT